MSMFHHMGGYIDFFTTGTAKVNMFRKKEESPGRIQLDKNITARNQPAVVSTDGTACLCLLQPCELERT